MASHYDTIREAGETAVQLADQETDCNMMTQFKTDNITLIGTYTHLTFEVEAKKTIVLPNAVTLNATQKGHQLRQTLRRGICNVYKGKHVYTGNLLNRDVALNSNTNYVLLMQGNGVIIKIMQPDRITIIPDMNHIHPPHQGCMVKVEMLLENVLNAEFRHSLSEIVAVNKGEGDERETNVENTFVLEQAVVISNDSPYGFKTEGDAKISIPKIGEECGDGKVDNTTLIIKNIGELSPHGKETIVFSECKMDMPRKYKLVSAIYHHKAQSIFEFTVPNNMYPGNLTQYSSTGEISTISTVPYIEKGGKILLRQGIFEDIVMLDNISIGKGFKMTIENKSKEVELVRIAEMAEITDLVVDNIAQSSDIMSLTSGIHIITGNYIL
jgi:hypothetical protein